MILSINPCRLAGWDAVGNGVPISNIRQSRLRPGPASAGADHRLGRPIDMSKADRSNLTEDTVTRQDGRRLYPIGNIELS